MDSDWWASTLSELNNKIIGPPSLSLSSFTFIFPTCCPSHLDFHHSGTEERCYQSLPTLKNGKTEWDDCKSIYQTEQSSSCCLNITLITASASFLSNHPLITNEYLISFQRLKKKKPRKKNSHAEQCSVFLDETLSFHYMHLCLLLLSGWPGERRVRQLWTEMPFCCSDFAAWQRWSEDQLLSGVLLIVFIDEKTCAAGEHYRLGVKLYPAQNNYITIGDKTGPAIWCFSHYYNVWEN